MHFSKPLSTNLQWFRLIGSLKLQNLWVLSASVNINHLRQRHRPSNHPTLSAFLRSHRTSTPPPAVRSTSFRHRPPGRRASLRRRREPLMRRCRVQSFLRALPIVQRAFCLFCSLDLKMMRFLKTSSASVSLRLQLLWCWAWFSSEILV